MNDQSQSQSPMIQMLDDVAQATMTEESLKASGSGKAYQAVALATAMAIQDATENLRSMHTIGSTAVGVAISQYLATGNDEYKDVLDRAMNLVSQASKDFRSIGENAAYVLASFPAGGETAP